MTRIFYDLENILYSGSKEASLETNAKKKGSGLDTKTTGIAFDKFAEQTRELQEIGILPRQGEIPPIRVELAYTYKTDQTSMEQATDTLQTDYEKNRQEDKSYMQKLIKNVGNLDVYDTVRSLEVHLHRNIGSRAPGEDPQIQDHIRDLIYYTERETLIPKEDKDCIHQFLLEIGL
jgi:hypothetical protein